MRVKALFCFRKEELSVTTVQQLTRKQVLQKNEKFGIQIFSLTFHYSLHSPPKLSFQHKDIIHKLKVK